MASLAARVHVAYHAGHADGTARASHCAYVAHIARAYAVTTPITDLSQTDRLLVWAHTMGFNAGVKRTRTQTNASAAKSNY